MAAGLQNANRSPNLCVLLPRYSGEPSPAGEVHKRFSHATRDARIHLPCCEKGALAAFPIRLDRITRKVAIQARTSPKRKNESDFRAFCCRASPAVAVACLPTYMLRRKVDRSWLPVRKAIACSHRQRRKLARLPAGAWRRTDLSAGCTHAPCQRNFLSCFFRAAAFCACRMESTRSDASRARVWANSTFGK